MATEANAKEVKIHSGINSQCTNLCNIYIYIHIHIIFLYCIIIWEYKIKSGEEKNMDPCSALIVNGEWYDVITNNIYSFFRCTRTHTSARLKIARLKIENSKKGDGQNNAWQSGHFYINTQ